MLQRLTTGWTYTRAIYLILGSFLIIHSIWDKQWFGIPIGGYFAAMGLFAFGCASGNCYGGTCETDSENKHKSDGLNLTQKTN